VKLSVVIPTLNEESSVAQVIDEVKARLNGQVAEGDYEILIVDGMSTDGTRAIAAERGATVVEEPRKGYGRAYKTGFAVAKGEVIATMDGDCTYPPEMIVPLMLMLERDALDFITTDRFAHMEKGAMSGMHKVGNLGLSFMARMLFGRIIRDSQSGMWVFRREALSRINVTDDGMPFSEEIKIEAFRKLRSREVDIPYRRRVGDVKLSSWHDGWSNFKFLLWKRFKGPRDRSLHL